METIDFNFHPWMDIAMREAGVAEIPGPKSNPRIDAYLKGVGQNADDEIAWCSAFANWVLRSAEYAFTKRANARSWLNYGIKLDKPVYGCIDVFWRDNPTSAKGHVAFHLGIEGSNHRVFGGNQGNMVCGALYPRARYIGSRWPVLIKTT